jgi:hypothetical protein
MEGLESEGISSSSLSLGDKSSGRKKYRRQRPFTLTLDDSFAVQCRVVIGRHTHEKGRSLSYTKIKTCKQVFYRFGELQIIHRFEAPVSMPQATPLQGALVLDRSSPYVRVPYQWRCRQTQRPSLPESMKRVNQPRNVRLATNISGKLSPFL